MDALTKAINNCPNIYRTPHTPLFIVQVGAHLGKTRLDPMYHLLESGVATGILIEPVKYIFDQMVKNYSRPQIFENVAIAKQEGIAKFYRVSEQAVEESKKLIGAPDWFDQIGSLSPERTTAMWDRFESHNIPHEWKWKEFINQNLVVEEVQCTTLNKLLLKHKVRNIDILQVDAEGYDFEVLKTIDLDAFCPSIIHYEKVLLSREDHFSCLDMLMSNNYSVQNDKDMDILAIYQGDKQAFSKFL